MNALTLFRLKFQILGRLFPNTMAKNAAQLFLTPRASPKKEWEYEAEKNAESLDFANGLKATSWGHSDQKILLMHGWESRGSHMFHFLEPLLAMGFQVIAIDAPLHGKSLGDKANPVSFADAILAAQKELGPFTSVVGHSMGAAAVAIALDQGAKFSSCVLVSSPACISDGLEGFINILALPKRCGALFIKQVEAEVGRSRHELDVAKTLERLQPRSLLIHDQHDKEIPFSSLERLKVAHPKSQILVTEGLGHRRIIRDVSVANAVAQFISAA